MVLFLAAPGRPASSAGPHLATRLDSFMHSTHAGLNRRRQFMLCASRAWILPQ
jgi:hypothetical protein